MTTAALLYFSKGHKEIILSGRTAAYRASILQDPNFLEAFTNDYWRGQYRLDSGDDVFISKWIYCHKWKACYQVEKEFEVFTTVKADHNYLKQLIRWQRNSARYRLRGGYSMQQMNLEYFRNLIVQTILSNFHNDLYLLLDLFTVLAIGLCLYFGSLGKFWAADRPQPATRAIALEYFAFNCTLEILANARHLARFPTQLKFLPTLAIYGHIRGYATIYAYFTLYQVSYFFLILTNTI
jgi:hypothetical protein